MIFPIYFDSKNSLNLYGLIENFNFLKELFKKKKMPKVLMLSGKKGSGKSTLVNHLMYYIYDKENYDEKTCKYKKNTVFMNQFINNIYTNIIYLPGSDFKNIRVEEIRNLKKKILQTNISDKPRFIILDDVELFNNNSLNALLKIIEEPTINNYFLLINNNTKSLIKTIRSRCLEIKIILNEKKRINIVESLIKKFQIDLILDPTTSQLSPGNFLKFNYIFDENKISHNGDFLNNLKILLNLYKKNKDPVFTNIILFLTNDYFNKLKYDNSFTTNKIIEYKIFVFENINKFFLYNLNPNALLNVIDNKINND
jgi:DNA polymerase III subunit delta'